MAAYAELCDRIVIAFLDRHPDPVRPDPNAAEGSEPKLMYDAQELRKQTKPGDTRADRKAVYLITCMANKNYWTHQEALDLINALPQYFTSSIELGNFFINLIHQEVLWNDQRVGRLGPQYFRALLLLAQHKGAPCTFAQIYAHLNIRGCRSAKDNKNAAVRSYIARLRRHFRKVDAGFDGIITHPNFGYSIRV